MAMRLLPLLFAVLPCLSQAQNLTSPEKFFGHEIGADYVLPNYTKFSEYWNLLDRESDKMRVISIGKTEEGRDQLMAIVTSAANQKRLNQNRSISEKLASGKVDEATARQLAKEGKIVVWIDGGLHATEVLGAQQLIETTWRLVSRNDDEVKRILDDVIILLVHANPDGMELCSDWYMRNPDPLKRSLAGLPRLYEKYAGHDNNRDFYMANLAETRNMNRIMYLEWFPQIMYNHHQTGPAGTVMFAPPFRDPFNHNIDPLVITSLDMVGENMHRRMIEEGKPGTTMRSGSPYSTWWNGGLRTTAYFHNMVGILTETIGSPTPFQIPVVPNRLVPTGATPFPIEPRLWKFRESIEYSWTANMSILDLASRYKEQFLFNFWKMGRNAIAKGHTDTWTNYPTRVEELAKKAKGEDLLKALKAPELRDAKAYVIPSDQPTFRTAVKFANTLLMNGIEVYRTKAASKDYPAGSLVIPAAQAFRAHIIDMFEPQDHPNDFPAPGAPPTQPYDNAGYTLAYQMGIDFDRILDPLPALELDRIFDLMPMPKGQILPGNQPGFAFAPFDNGSMVAVQRLQKAGFEVQRFQRDDDHALIGSFYAPPAKGLEAEVSRIAGEAGVSFTKTVVAPKQPLKLNRVRVGLWDRYGGSMESGWTRFVLEQFEVPYTVVYPKELDAGKLRDKYDVLIFPDGAIPAGQGRGGNAPDNIPAEFQHMLGAVTVNATVPKLKEFLEAGGSVVTIGSSTSLGYHLGLPIENALEGLKNTQYYVPGSILRARVDLLQPSAWGTRDHVDVFFDNSPVFKFKEGAEAAGLKKVAWFDTDKPLRSGWAWGQEKLKDGIAIIEAPVGKGKLYLFGPEILFRGQPHGTFKFLFNAILNS